MTTAFDEAGECPHGLGDPAWCTLCSGKDQRAKTQAAAEANEVVALLIARFPGDCARCGDPIRKGDAIAKMADGRYLCGDCTPGRD